MSSTFFITAPKRIELQSPAWTQNKVFFSSANWKIFRFASLMKKRVFLHAQKVLRFFSHIVEETIGPNCHKFGMEALVHI